MKSQIQDAMLARADLDVPVKLAEEFAIFRREMEDILAAAETGDLEAVGHIRRAHISMSFMRMMRYARQPLAEPPFE